MSSSSYKISMKRSIALASAALSLSAATGAFAKGKAVPLGNERDYVTDDALPTNYVYSNAEANRYDSAVKPYREEFRNKYHLPIISGTD
jgi:spermidine/putrescine-binding protein